jgi:transposase
MQPWPLGLDIAKRAVDAELLLPSGKRKQKRFPNTPEGHRDLLAWCRKQGAPLVHACMEATGTYGLALAQFLHDQEQRVSVLNPKKLVHAAKSRLSRGKTDRLDAGVAADYCRKEQPPLWNPPAPELVELQALLRRLDSLEQMRQMERNRLSAGEHPKGVQQSLESHLRYLDEALEATREAIQAQLEHTPQLKKQRDLLVSIPGIGALTAAWLLAELGEVGQFKNPRQVAAFAGLSPKPHQSGEMRGRERLCKIGSARLRKALYFPAITALQWNPILRAFGERLLSRGKSKMLVIGAAMRKLLHLAYGVLKSGKKFDPHHATTVTQNPRQREGAGGQTPSVYLAGGALARS